MQKATVASPRSFQTPWYQSNHLKMHRTQALFISNKVFWGPGDTPLHIQSKTHQVDLKFCFPAKQQLLEKMIISKCQYNLHMPINVVLCPFHLTSFPPCVYSPFVSASSYLLEAGKINIMSTQCSITLTVLTECWTMHTSLFFLGHSQY